MAPATNAGESSLLALLALTNAVVGVVASPADSDNAQALAVSQLELAPGTIVGRGRYVLAEKLGDVHGPQAAYRHQAHLPPPSDRLLLDKPDTTGQLVPYEGLTRAIALDLPQLPQLPSPTPNFLPAVFDYSVSFLRGDPLFQEETWGYRFGQKLGKGSFGEAWRAVALDGSMREVVLKRLFVERGEHVRRSGEREIYFGSVLQNRPHIARFVESFEQQHGGARHRLPELWLVFHNEGFSLTHHLFRLQPGSMLVELSAFWWTVKKQQPVGSQVIKSLVYQLLHGVAVAHDLNFTHRDIKPSNVFVTDTWPPVVRLGDWGSALVNPPASSVSLYDLEGPTEADETEGYQPPEVSFDDELLERAGLARASAWRGVAYDLWSLGVLLLELILGTREVFHVEDRRWLRIEHQLKQWRVPSRRFAHARRLQALLDLCLVPRTTPRGAGLDWFFAPQQLGPSRAVAASRPGAASSCSDEAFAELLRQRDAAGVGLPSSAGRDLVRQLLEWSPLDRITAREALAHAWFDDGAQLPPLRTLLPPRSKGLPAPTCDTQAQNDGVLSSGCRGLSLNVAALGERGRRPDMEDRYAVHNLSAGSFVGIFDGHNGAEVAERLRRSLHRHLAADPAFPENISSALEGAFATFDGVLARERGEADDVATDPGSTALVSVAAGCRLHLANLGDCRAVVARREAPEGPWPPGARVEVREAASADLRGQRGTIVEVRGEGRRRYVVRLLRDGELRPLREGSLRLLSELQALRLTEDHKPGSSRERQRIEEMGGEVEFPTERGGTARVRGLATSRSFGSLRARPFVSTVPDVSERALEAGRDVFVVLASDGVWDVLEDQLVVDIVWDQISSVHDSRKGPAAALEDAVQLVVQSALDRGALDNLTCAVVLLTWDLCEDGNCTSPARWS